MTNTSQGKHPTQSKGSTVVLLILLTVTYVRAFSSLGIYKEYGMLKGVLLPSLLLVVQPCGTPSSAIKATEI